ncbi:MAG: hypothetical protein U0Q19_03690 [Kineosporiaceae bacterium]
MEISVQMAQRQRDLADGLRSAQEDMAAVTEPREVLARLVARAPRLVGCQGCGCSWKGPRRAWWCWNRTVPGA